MDKKIIYILIGLLILIGISSYLIIQSNPDFSKNFTINEGYKVINSTNHSMVVNNGTDTYIIEKGQCSTDLNKAVNKYAKHYNDTYSTKKTKEKIGSNITVIKTESIPLNSSNQNSTITKYWFKKDKEIYVIQNQNNSKNLKKFTKDFLSKNL